MNESIIELLNQLPESAVVGKTYDYFKGGWMCCSYYEAIKEYSLRNYVPDITDNDLFPVGYGTTPEEAIKDSIRQYSID